jgi:hypothetical protein
MHPAQRFCPGRCDSTSMPTAYSPGLQRLSELPGLTLVQGPCVVPDGLAVVGRPSCASTPELDAIMAMANAAIFVCGFTPALLPLAIQVRPPAKLSRAMLKKQMIQAYFDTSPSLSPCKGSRFIEGRRWVQTQKSGQATQLGRASPKSAKGRHCGSSLI